MSKSRKQSNPVTEAIHYCEKECDKAGLESRFISDEIGRGVFATRKYSEGEFLLQYVGEVITVREAQKREIMYAKKGKGCFLYFVGKLCFDATKDDGRLGRLCNDATGQKQNSAMRTIRHNGNTYLCLFATKNIRVDEEIRYDYGVPDLPWRSDEQRKIERKNVIETPKKVSIVLEMYKGPSSIRISSAPEMQPQNTALKIQPETTVPEMPPKTYVPEMQLQTGAPDVQQETVNPEMQPDNTAKEIQPENTVPEMQQKTYFPDMQPESSAPEIQPEAVDPEMQPQTTVPEMQPQSTAQEIQPETTAEIRTETSDNEMQSETCGSEPQPENDVSEIQPETGVSKLQSETTAQEMQTETKASEIQPERSDSEKQQETSVSGMQPQTSALDIQLDTSASKMQPQSSDPEIQPQLLSGTSYQEMQRDIRDPEMQSISSAPFRENIWHNPYLWQNELLRYYNTPTQLYGSHYNSYGNQEYYANSSPWYIYNPAYFELMSHRIPMYQQTSVTMSNTSTSQSTPPHQPSPDIDIETLSNECQDNDVNNSTEFQSSALTDRCEPMELDPIREIEDESIAATCAGNSDAALSIENGNANNADNSNSNLGDTQSHDLDDLQPGTSNADNIGSMDHEKKHTEYPNVIVPLFTHQGRRDRSIRHCCFYCSDMCLKMSLHLRIHHADEDEVAKAATKNKKDCIHELEKLRLMGDFNHNMAVIRKKEGTLILPRKSSAVKVVEDYLACTYCFAFINKWEMSKHIKRCTFRNEKPENETTYSSSKQRISSQNTLSRVLMQGALVDDAVVHDSNVSRVRQVVVGSMHHGKIRQYVGKDVLILHYGATLLEKLGEGRKHDISQRMRQLARLVIQVEKDTGKSTNMMELIDGARFDDVVAATRQICGENKSNKSAAGVQLFKAPSYGLQVGHALVKCTLMKRGMALRNKDMSQKLDADTFKQLHEAEWTDKISSRSLQTMKERKYNSVELLPLTSDLIKLRDDLEQRIVAGKAELEENTTIAAWRELSRALYCAATLFNKRRGGETAKMITDAFVKRPNWKALANEEIKESLSDLEKRLVMKLDMVQLPGKRGRCVSLLLKPKWIEAMDLLVKRREECKVHSQYFFGVPNAAGHLSGWKILRKAALMADCEMPQLISSTKLRKYVATVTQVLDLKEGEIEWLGNHLGHTLHIHREAYRLHESTVELAKVSKILLAVDQGEISKFQGMSLDDVEINDIEANLEGDGSDEEEDDVDLDEEAESDIENDREDNVPVNQMELAVIDDLDVGEEEEDNACQVPSATKRKVSSTNHSGGFTKKIKTPVNRTKWSDDEMKAIRDGFDHYINDLKKVPGQSIVQQVVTQYPILQQRTVAIIKAKVQHIIKQTTNQK